MHVRPVRHIAFAVALAAMPAISCAQVLDVAPKSVTLLQVEHGPIAVGKLMIRSSGQPQQWTATATPENPNEPWLTLSAGSGVTPATLTLGIVTWRGEEKKPGKFHHTITIRSGGTVVTVPVVWEVRPPIAASPYS